MDLLILLLVGGALAIGLPHITRRSERRIWHPWVNSGLLPLVIGLAIGPFLGHQLQAQLGLILALATAAAGVLVGTQLRATYLRRAGGLFIRRHSIPVLVCFHLSAVPTLILLLLSSEIDWWTAVAWSGVVGALVVATTQRTPMSGASFDVNHRDLVLGHIAPAGWWNLMAIALAGAALALTLTRQHGLAIAIPSWLHAGTGYAIVAVPRWSMPLVELLLPAGLGLVLGWLAKRARNRDEAILFLLAVLGVAGGAGLVLGAPPLFVGLIIGAVFANLAQERAALVERALEGLEQPTVVATGLITGLVLQAPPSVLPVWILAGVVIVARILLRGHLSPTSATLSSRAERRMTPAGATGVLLIGALATMGEAAMILVPPLTVCLVLQTAAYDIFEFRSRRLSFL